MDSIEKRQMSESVLVGSLLVLTGGFLDAYSYLCRGEVFANAQTGNIVLLGIQIAEGDWSMALRISFACCHICCWYLYGRTAEMALKAEGWFSLAADCFGH